ncbi:Mss4-like protein [Cladochytrium replicatum]|nr:Mss4-like protein [Cladochytrium replicatum]
MGDRKYPIPDNAVTADGKNSADILCAHGCRSVILKKLAAEGVHMEVDVPMYPGNGQQLVWKVKDQMTFENVGVSRAYSDTDVRFLICADCERGPIGCRTAAQDYIVFADRVKYGSPSA